MIRNGAAVRAPHRKEPLFALLWLLVAFGTSLVGLAFGRNRLDSFRIPKQSLYQAEAIVCLALLLILLLWRRREVIAALRTHRLTLGIVAAAVLWTALSSLTSTNRTLSMPAMLWVASCATVFVATLLVACRGKGLAMLWLPLLAAFVNAVIVVGQRAGWSPTVFSAQIEERYRVSGLIGNANDVGVYFFFCTIAAVALALAYRGRKTLYNVLALSLFAALLACQTVSALIAFACAALLLIVLFTGRVKSGAAFVAAGIVLVLIVSPLRHRAAAIGQDLRAGSFTAATSLRLPAYAVAWRLFLDHPIVGAGPGTYGWWYLPYKLRLDGAYPTFHLSTENFGEAHNDHLQTLAVGGLPGYVIFAAALVSLGALSFRKTEANDARSRFARLLALPLAGGFAVVALAQFPLEIASASSVAIHYAALCCAWAARE